MEQRQHILEKLRKDILLWEGFKPGRAGQQEKLGLGPLEKAFPNGVFPKGVIHEFVAENREHAAAGNGFLGGILASLMKDGGISLWISTCPLVYPAALASFGLEPDRMIFIHLKREQEVLWAMEEALKCEGLAAVVAELEELDFTASRRLQLATEQSRVTGFILRSNLRKLKASACTVRWCISPVASQTAGGLPGVGFPRWQVALLKVRNGKTGSWTIEWAADHFLPVEENKEPFSSKQTGT